MIRIRISTIIALAWGSLAGVIALFFLDRPFIVFAIGLAAMLLAHVAHAIASTWSFRAHFGRPRWRADRCIHPTPSYRAPQARGTRHEALVEGGG